MGREPVRDAGDLGSTHEPGVDRAVALEQLAVPGDERTVRHVFDHLPQPRGHGHVSVLARLAVLERFPLRAVSRRLPGHPQDGAVLYEVLLAHRQRLLDAKAAATHEPYAQPRAAHVALAAQVGAAIRHELDLFVRREHEALARVSAAVGQLDAVKTMLAELARLHCLFYGADDDMSRLLARRVAQVLHLDPYKPRDP